MTSGEGTLWLRECSAARDSGTLDDLKPRPVKATLLSWLAKAGNFSMSERGSPGETSPCQGCGPAETNCIANTFNADAQPSRIVRAALKRSTKGGDGASASDVEEQEDLEIAV